jgi:predicted ATPase
MSDTTQAPAADRLGISRIAIRNYRSLRNVQWPEDGLGWGGEIPETVLVGGINGSGKTTLLETVFGVVSFMIDWDDHDYREIDDRAYKLLPHGAEHVEIQLDTGVRGRRGATVRSSRFERPLEDDGQMKIWVPSPREPGEAPVYVLYPQQVIAARRELAEMCRKPDGPHLLYFPTDRAVPIPVTRFKRPGSSDVQEPPIYRYESPAEWERSVEAVLYDARWRDLNAKEQGDPAAATNFAAYEDALAEFFGGTKRFVWDRDGVLHVQTKDGDRHPLESLSSGEKQVLLFVAELFRRWTPGSLVLLDEPELHLHESWLAALWSALRRLQRERGGQVIVTTQSNYLFGLGGTGNRVVLRGGAR